MTSLNKDSTFEREDLSEMLSVGQKISTLKDSTIGGNSRRKSDQMAQIINFGGSNIDQLLKGANEQDIQLKSIEKQELQRKLFGESQKTGDDIVYSQEQLNQIRQQILRVSQENAKHQLDEDEEFKLAESLAESFVLSDNSNHLSHKELSIALQRSFRQLAQEKAMDLAQSQNTETLNYSMTQASRPATTMGGQSSLSGKKASQFGGAPSISDHTIRIEDEFVNSMSRSQLPQFLANRKQESDDNNASGQARQFYYGADEQAMSVKSRDFDDVYEVSGHS